MKKNTIYKYLIVVLLIVLSLFLIVYFRVINFSALEFNNILDPVAIVGLLLTAIITIWIGSIFVQRMTEDRFLKESVIRDIVNMEEYLLRIENLLSTNPNDISTVFNYLTSLEHKLSVLTHTLDIYKFNKGTSELKKIVELHIDLYSITTDSDSSTSKEKMALTTDILKEIRKLLKTMIYQINMH